MESIIDRSMDSLKEDEELRRVLELSQYDDFSVDHSMEEFKEEEELRRVLELSQYDDDSIESTMYLTDSIESSLYDDALSIKRSLISMEEEYTMQRVIESSQLDKMNLDEMNLNEMNLDGLKHEEMKREDLNLDELKRDGMNHLEVMGWKSSFTEVHISGENANCLFETVRQGAGMSISASDMRMEVVHAVTKCKDEIIFDLKTADEWIRDMSLNGTFGDEICIEMISHIYNLTLHIYQDRSIIPTTYVGGPKIVYLYHKLNHFNLLLRE